MSLELLGKQNHLFDPREGKLMGWSISSFNIPPPPPPSPGNPHVGIWTLKIDLFKFLLLLEKNLWSNASFNAFVKGKICNLIDFSLLSYLLAKVKYYTLDVRSQGKHFVLGNTRTCGKTKLTSFLREHTLSTLLFFIRFSLKQSYGKNKQTKMVQLLYSHACGQQLLNCILVRYIWIWSGACDQESNNHIACFVEWKSRFIIITSKHLHIWRYNTCFWLERLETTCSNSPPHPDKVQILHPPGTEDVQMPMGYPGGVGRGMLKLWIDHCVSV